MYQFRMPFGIVMIMALSCRIVEGENPDMFIAEGTEAPGRVLALQKDELERSFSRSNVNHRTHTTRIGSIEFLSSDEFYL